MDRIRQSRESLQTPTNQWGLSGVCDIPQGVKDPRSNKLQPMDLIQPLKTPVSSVGIQRPPRLMSPLASVWHLAPQLSGVWQQAVPWIHGPTPGIFTDSSLPTQHPSLEMLHITEGFNNMTTGSVPLRRMGLVRRTLQGRKIIDEKYRHVNRLDTIPEKQNLTEGSKNVVAGKKLEQLIRGSVRERRITQVRQRYGRLLPQSSFRNVGLQEELFQIDKIRSSGTEGFRLLHALTRQPVSSRQSELVQEVKRPSRTQLQPIHSMQPLQTPATSVGIQCSSPNQMSPSVSGAWQKAAPTLFRPRLGTSRDSSRPRQIPSQEILIEKFNNMTTDNNI